MTRRQSRLKITDVGGNAAINRQPLRRAIQSVNRSKEASKQMRDMAEEQQKRGK